MLIQQIRNATLKLTYGHTRLLIDPWLARAGTMPAVESPYNELKNPLVELPLPLGEIVDTDAVIVTHMHHFDHFDETAANALPKSMPVFVQNREEAQDMRNLGFQDVTPLTGQGVNLGPVTLYRTGGRHGAGDHVARVYKEKNIPAEVCGVVLRCPQEKTLYIAGDTIWCDDVREALDTYRPEVIVLNCGQAQFFDDPIIMGAEDVLRVARHAPGAIIVASHMEAVNHARLSRAQLRADCREVPNLYIPADGEILEL